MFERMQKGDPGTEAGVTDAKAIPQQVWGDIVAGMTSLLHEDVPFNPEFFEFVFAVGSYGYAQFL